MSEHDRYRPIGDYALIADCHTAALVSREGSVDWCCVPRFDSGSAFGRLLDYAGDGYCALTPADGGSWESKRSYLEDSFVLETTLTSGSGEVRMVACFVLHEGDQAQHVRRIVRVIEGAKGSVKIDLRIVPRFDYGEVRPWVRRHGKNLFASAKRHRADDRLVAAMGGDYDYLSLSHDATFVRSATNSSIASSRSFS